MTGGGSPRPLPQLRPELEMVRGAPGPSGEPCWLIHDPLANRFIQIDRAAFETLAHWRTCRTADELAARVNATGDVRVDAQSLEPLVAFLIGNRLTVAPSSGWRQLAHQEEARRPSGLSRLLHDYLFLRVPLCRPQRFLERTLPLVRWLAAPATSLAIAIMGVAGLYLVMREWDVFVATFQGHLTWEGALAGLAALALVKVAHELGHAYTTVAYGCRVHSMGVALVLMAPVLYTDVTDSWRLRERRQRLAIDSAGIRVELAVAAIALFLWAFLPEGPARSIAFTLSVVSIASSLAINLNPFMRFDGYYLLSEALAVDNLQPRAFELGRWRMREVLLGLRRPPPEVLPRRLAAILVAYAWATWVYRLVLYVGIALLVYHYFFKVLGLILLVVELCVFIGRPVMSELRIWWRERRAILGARRAAVSAGLAGLVLLACLLPWSTKVEIPAIAESARLQPIHASRSARIVEVAVSQGAEVRAGDVLLRLASPEIEQEIEAARTRLALARLQHGRRAADAEDRAGTIVIESTIASLATRLDGLESERAALTVRAPFDGRVVELDRDMHVGRWVGPKDLIAMVAGAGETVVRGYVAESDLWRIVVGGSGKFVPETALRGAIPVRIETVAAAGAAEIEIPELASVHSGRIVVQPGDGRRLVPTSAQYQVRMSAEEVAPQEIALRGVVVAEGRAESLFARVWRQTLKVLMRESGA